MNFHFDQTTRRCLQFAVLTMFCGAVVGPKPGCAAEGGSSWQTEVNTDQSAPAENGDNHDAKAKVPRKQAAQVAGRRSGAKAAVEGTKLPISGTTQRPRVPSIETGSVDAVNAVPSRAPVPAAADATPSPMAVSSTAGRFCVNIKPQVEEMRIAFQKKTLAEIEAELDQRLKLLEGKITEYKQWLQRRQDFSNKAQDALVKIYTKMRPDAAAQQLASAETETAAAVLLKLDPRVASAILNDMDPKLAATLAAVITGAAQTKDDAPKAPGAAP